MSKTNQEEKVRPWAVLTSDVHYSLPTLPLADEAMRQAIARASRLNVPLIVAGDLHDTKGAMRGECISAMLKTFQEVKTPTYVMPGNHDRINEKSKPHSLEFLRHLVSMVDVPTCMHGLWMVPYESDSEVLKAFLRDRTAGSTLIMHTGLQGAKMGHYTRDTSSLEGHLYHGLRVVSGHYHARQDIPIPGGEFSYIGNPYTLNFGEALDPPKGFQVLNTDGTLTFVPTNLRKHIVVEMTTQDPWRRLDNYSFGDILKVKLHGPRSELEQVSRMALGEALIGSPDFRLDLVPTPTEKLAEVPTIAATVAETMDRIIDASSETAERKAELKSLWRSLSENP